MAKKIETPTPQEYQLLTKEGNALGEKMDTLEFLNECGRDGWIVMEIKEQIVASGMVNDKGEAIPKVVLMVLARRPVYTQETVAPASLKVAA